MTKRRLTITVFFLLLITLVVYIVWPTRPPRQSEEIQLFQGITYTRQARSIPRPLMIHIVTIDVLTPGIGFLVTPPAVNQERELLARTTGEFLEEYQVQVAINGSFFSPFYSRGPWNYYPRSGDPVDVKGLAIANGVVYSQDYSYMSSVCIEQKRVKIRTDGCGQETPQQALTGNPMLVNEGMIQVRQIEPREDNLHPRTAVGVDKTGQRLWLVVVDGRQVRYSEGVTLYELAEIMVAVGADMAMNLDGGGSSTLVMEHSGQAQVLNAPYHTRILMRQRPVANHLGVYALPLVLE